MIIIGIKRTAQQLATLMLFCHTCRGTFPASLDRTVTKVTVFLVPLFPVRAGHRLSCTRCGTAQRLSKADAERARRTAEL